MAKGRDLVAAGIAALCLAPSAVCNILPHILTMTAQGGVEGASATTAVFQTASVLAMSGMPFAIKNLRAATLKAACLLLGSVLFILNFMNALDVASHGRELATDGSRGTIARATGLNSRLAELHKSRAQIPPFTFTSAASASAAQKAADEAVTARDTECRKVGDNCRKRVSETAEAAEKLSKILDQRTLTERSEKFDAAIAQAETDLANLGPVPKHGDDTAAKMARIAGLFVNVGNDADEAVSEWRPILFAVGIELLAFIGPLGMMAAISGGTSQTNWDQPERKQAKPEPKKPEKVATPVAELATHAATPATPGPSKKRKPFNDKAVAGAGEIREWFKSRTAARPGTKVRVNEIYSAYVEWCKERGLEAASLTKFGTMMKGELGVGYVEKSKRGYYTDLVIVAGLKVVKGGAQA